MPESPSQNDLICQTRQTTSHRCSYPHHIAQAPNARSSDRKTFCCLQENPGFFPHLPGSQTGDRSIQDQKPMEIIQMVFSGISLNQSWCSCVGLCVCRARANSKPLYMTSSAKCPSSIQPLIPTIHPPYLCVGSTRSL